MRSIGRPLDWATRLVHLRSCLQRNHPIRKDVANTDGIARVVPRVGLWSIARDVLGKPFVVAGRDWRSFNAVCRDRGLVQLKEEIVVGRAQKGHLSARHSGTRHQCEPCAVRILYEVVVLECR